MRLILLIILINHPVTSQIVNVESKRMRTDTTGWSGSAELNFQFIKVEDAVYDFGSKIHFQYKQTRSLWLFLNEFRLIKAEGRDFVNSGFAHLRYNYKVIKFLRWEVFVQLQYNDALNVGLRGLTGTGPRFKFYHSDYFRIYAGTLYMFEYIHNNNRTIFERNHRNSGYNYISFTIDINKVDFTSTAYYQPKLTDFKDYLLYSQSKLTFEITDRLDFVTEFLIRYDSNPFPDIPKKSYNLNNGLLFSF